MDSSRLKILLFLPILMLLLASCSSLSNSYSYNGSRSNGGVASRPVKKTVEPALPTQDDLPRDIEEEEEAEEEFDESSDFEEATAEPKISDETQLRLNIADYAEDYLGTKYVYGGKTPAGFDCSGFVYHVLKKFEVNLPGSSAYQAKEGVKVNLKKAQTGDLIFFRKTAAGKVFHVAMVVENDDEGLKVIHSTSRGVVIDNISTSQYWKPKISMAKDVLSD